MSLGSRLAKIRRAGRSESIEEVSHWRRISDGIRWEAVAVGWSVAVLGGVVISLVLHFLYELITGFAVERGVVTLSVVSISLVSGFQAYLVGGYVAGRLARRFGGLNGTMTALFGLIPGVILAIVLDVYGVVFPEGVAAPPACFGLTAEALLAGLVLLLFNLFGAYLGGQLGEPYRA